MQAHITGGVVALWLSVSFAQAQGIAQAQGNDGRAEGRAHGESNATTQPSETREHLRRAKSELEQAGEAAAEDTRKAIKDARDGAHETVKEARTAASEAAELAREKARELREQAQETAEQAQIKARELREEAREVANRGADQARAALQRADDAARELSLQARTAFHEASEKFDGDPNSPEGLRHARRIEERKETWRRLREQIKAKDSARPEIDPPLKTELAVHARRHARLTRIRDLARENKDEKAAAKVEVLLERERARHERRVEMLTAHAEPDGPEGE